MINFQGRGACKQEIPLVSVLGLFLINYLSQWPRHGDNQRSLQVCPSY